MDAGTRAILTVDLLNVIAADYQVHGSSSAATAVRVQTQLLLAGFLRLADQLDGTSGVLLSGARVSDDALREAAISALSQWQGDPESGRTALAIVIAGEWTQHLGDLITELEAPVVQAVKAAHVPWWR